MSAAVKKVAAKAKKAAEKAVKKVTKPAPKKKAKKKAKKAVKKTKKVEKVEKEDKPARREEDKPGRGAVLGWPGRKLAEARKLIRDYAGSFKKSVSRMGTATRQFIEAVA